MTSVVLAVSPGPHGGQTPGSAAAPWPFHAAIAVVAGARTAHFVSAITIPWLVAALVTEVPTEWDDLLPGSSASWEFRLGAAIVVAVLCTFALPSARRVRVARHDAT